MRSKTFKGLITSTEGLTPIQLFSVPLDNVKEANSQTSANRGLRLLYGRTEKGEVYEFIKAGRLAKRDLTAMKALGVVEAAASWSFAPANFEIPEGQVTVSRKIELGQKTTDLLDRWAKALS